ncbi:hypothetical protein [Mycoplasmopsis cynos]|uniref:hypothetical protein n=1 Tax=Mycoplasmopsis cynos TaxID=171284 RepID=UPI0021FC80BC|nr:hypothetical protein [Mycoplasmopsis cynos]UWV82369.1 hypothetical protein NW067_05245 [Mycoplasmopsis cynos]
MDDEGINALKINDKTSKVNLNLGLIGFDNKISFKIKRSKNSQNWSRRRSDI